MNFRVLFIRFSGSTFVSIFIMGIVIKYATSDERSWISKHGDFAKSFYDRRKNWKTSNLGSILFKNATAKDFPIQKPQNKNFLIIQWKWGGYRRGMYIHDYRSQANPLEGCSVQNCIFSNKLIDSSADAVIVNLKVGQVPHMKRRNLNQRWILLNDGSPAVQNYVWKIPEIANQFNWTMTYRSDSDIPVPYGRTIPFKMPQYDDLNDHEVLSDMIPYWQQKQREVIAATYISNCEHKDRMDFLQELKKHMMIDVHGPCSDNPEFMNSCPDYNKEDCPALNNYIFYIVLENSLCRQYFTEKVFYLAYSKGAIPVIRGPPVGDCEKMLPPNSTINVDSYPTVSDLAIHLRKIAKFIDTTLLYHKWRNYFQVVNEHGYFDTKSHHLCRVCEALNFNDGNVSVYDADDLRLFLDPTLICVNSSWS